MNRNVIESNTQTNEVDRLIFEQHRVYHLNIKYTYCYAQKTLTKTLFSYDWGITQALGKDTH